MHPTFLLGTAVDYAAFVVAFYCRLPYCLRRIDNRVISFVQDFSSASLVLRETRTSSILQGLVQVCHSLGEEGAAKIG